MKQFLIFILYMAVAFLVTSSGKGHKTKKTRITTQSRWTGHVSMEETITISAPKWTAESKRTIHASFVNTLPTLYRDEATTDLSFTDDKGAGNHTLHGEENLAGKRCVTDCQSSGKAELHAVVVNEDANTYDIEVVSPQCIGTTCGDDGITKPYEEIVSVIVSDHPLGTSKDILNGTKTEQGDLPGGTGTFTRIIKWHLTRTAEPDVELIVSPEKYDIWLPEPGRNESTAGTMLKVSLKVQGRNGTATTKKAKSFEIRLSNTSTEPGMTINFPVNSINTSPDLKFMPQQNAVMMDTLSQTMMIICRPASQTGECKIGSFDGGGWTVLNAEAILEDDTRVPGRLLVSNGEPDIRIPKREPNSKIAEAWLKTNGNPGETDDEDASMNNQNKGDGFTAYEEYRGVIAEGIFRRFNPKKKELGLNATKSDFTLFSEGINWFKSASDLEPVRFDFDKDEIAGDGKLNMNVKSAHDFDQYALFLLNGGTAPGQLGVTYGRRGPWIPANIIGVIINWNRIRSTYQDQVDEAMPETLKFTVKEYLAQTVAHELGHAVNVDHHGNDKNIDSFAVNNNSDSYRIFDRNRIRITSSISKLYNIGFENGTVESGDMSCMLNYYPYYSWGHTIGADGAHIFNQEPLLPLGKIFCTSTSGTGINATQLFFGNGSKGNCKGHIQLRN